MSTLDTNKLKKARNIYIGIAALCVGATAVYEHFSYGEYSVLMRGMFLFPLLGGALLFGLLARSKKSVSRAAYNLWNSGIAVFVSGCITSGIITISGRSDVYTPCYWAAGIVFLAAATAAGAVTVKSRRIL